MEEEKIKDSDSFKDPFEGMGDFLDFKKIMPTLLENEYFKKLQEKQNEYEKMKNQFDLLNWAVREKFKTLATISSLAATLLIIATFNEKIIILTNFVRWVLFILLLLIPISLFCLLLELWKAEHHGVSRVLESLQNITSKKEIDEKIKKEIRPSIRGWFTWIVGGLFIIISIIIATLVLLPIFKK